LPLLMHLPASAPARTRTRTPNYGCAAQSPDLREHVHRRRGLQCPPPCRRIGAVT